MKKVDANDPKAKSLKFTVPYTGEDPLTLLGGENKEKEKSERDSFAHVTKKANLTIRLEDEARIISSIHDASKRLTSGSIYSVVVDVSETGTLDIGVKDLNENVLAVSLLKRHNDRPGAGEAAGIRLGDVIFGINFIPAREGSKTLISIIRMETEKKKKFIHIQGWRCHQLCSDEIPGYQFPRANDMFVHSYNLFRTKVFNEWERWNFIEILLSHMVEDLRMLSEKIEGIEMKAPTSVLRQKQMQVLDLERNILQAKGLRTSLNVRIVHTKFKDDTVSYVVRIEDIESGLHWSINKRFNEFFTLYEELRDICPYTREIDFPKKRIAMKNSPKLVEIRIVGLELYIRKALHTLTLYASMDNSASRGLRHLQQFLGVDRKIDCIHPPPMDDQRAIEILAYQFLNDFNSPACQQCVRFISNIDLESLLEQSEEGYKPLLTFLHDAVAEVEQFVLQQHEQQLNVTLKIRRPEWTDDQRLKLVRLCIRRQVESALYLPLRRNVFRIVQSFVADKSKKLHHAIALLQHAKPGVFMVDYEISRTSILPKAIRAFRKAILSYLPVDQGQFLVESAKIIAELHTECRELKQAQQNEARAASKQPFSNSPHTSVSNPTTPPTISSKPFDKPPLARAPSDNGLLEKIPSRTSFTGGIFGSSGKNQPVERRPSLQDRIKDFVESDKKSKDSFDDDVGEVEDDSVLRVSFAVGPNLAYQYSAKRKLVDKNRSPNSINLEKDLKDMKLSENGAANSPDPSLPPVPPSESSSSLQTPPRSLPPIPENPLNPSQPPITPTDPLLSTPNQLENLSTRTRDSVSSMNSQSPTPVRRHSMSRPTSLLRKVSNEEMMSDPLLRPLAIEMSGTVIDKEYFEEVFDRYSQTFTYHEHDAAEDDMINNAISADDFLPLFTYVLVHAGVPHLFLLKELMVSLISNEDAYGECGYYLATLEAAIQHIMDIAMQHEGIVSTDGFYDEAEEVFDLGMFTPKN